MPIDAKTPLIGVNIFHCRYQHYGDFFGDPYAGVDPPLPGNPDAPGTGLWVARQFADQLTIADHPDGVSVTVELHRPA